MASKDFGLGYFPFDASCVALRLRDDMLKYVASIFLPEKHAQQANA